MKILTRAWIKKAEEDMRVARRLIQDEPDSCDAICFHCQQAAEKYLKAMLQELGTLIPRIHDLRKLVTLLAPQVPSLLRLRLKLTNLTQFAVDYRYPDRTATSRQAASAWKSAQEIERFLGAWLTSQSKSHRKRSSS